ncbi:MAG: HAD family phosphatase [Bacteroidota bacterium]
MNGIKNIIFDLGGVLLDIDFKRTFDAFEAIGFKRAEEWFKRADVNRLCLDFETGMFSPQELRSRFRELTGFTCSDAEFDHAWNALLGEFPADRIRCVQALAKRYNTYLLSNTNEIHCKYFNSELNKHFGIESLDHLLHKAWYSHDLGLRKPGEQIFRKVLESGRLNPGETLYVDDAEINVKVAESMGMKGLLVTPEFTIIEALKDL